MKSLNEIAAQLHGYDPHDLPADTAQAFLNALIQPVTESEPVKLLQALGRVLAQDVTSPVNVPPHNNSAMDGYAFAGNCLEKSTGSDTALELTVVGTVLAGQTWTGRVLAGQCVKIMTGAVMPEGLDTVVPFEQVSRDGDRIKLSPCGIQVGDNRRLQGEDIALGQTALSKGCCINPAALGLLASLGLPTVTVVRRIRVAYFSTGDEILSLGDSPRTGAVYDSNRYTLLGLLKRMGVDVIDQGVVRDNPVALEAAFRSAAAQADVVITSGGVSAGDADHTRAMMRQLGDVVFWKIAMRPGRPLAVGRLLSAKSASSPHGNCASSYTNDSEEHPQTGSLLLGLPGNPVAAMVSFLAFVRPALLHLMGSTPQRPLQIQARSLQTLQKKAGRTEYQRGIVSNAADGALQVQTTGNQGSGMLSSMVQANALIVLLHGQGTVNAGDWVTVWLFEGLMP